MRARYWDEALEVHADVQAGRRRRRRLRDRPHALPHRHADVRHAHGYVVQTLADLGWLGLALSLAALARLARRRRARARPAARATAGCRWDAERVGARDARRRRARLRRALARSTGPGSSPPTRARRCCAPAGSPAAGRCARGWRPTRRAGARRRRSSARGRAPRSAACGRRARPGSPARCVGRRVAVLVALAAAWAAFQPVRSVHAGDAVFARARARRARRPRPTSPRSRASATRCRSTRCSSSPTSRRLRQPAAGRAAALERAVGCSPPTPPRGGGSATCACRRSTSPGERCATSAPRYYLDPLSPVSRPTSSRRQRAVAAASRARAGRAAARGPPRRWRALAAARARLRRAASRRSRTTHRLLDGPTAQRRATLDEMKALGADRVRVTCCGRGSPRRPTAARARRFDAADPAATRRACSHRYDAVVRDAAARGLGVNFDVTGPGAAVGHAATAARRRRDHLRAVAAEFGHFVTALGRRYSGDVAGVPRVDYWSLWNEPNQSGWLTPQWRGQKVRARRRALPRAGRRRLGGARRHRPPRATRSSSATPRPRACASRGVKRFLTPLRSCARCTASTRASAPARRGGPRARLPGRQPARASCARTRRCSRPTGFAHHPYNLLEPPPTPPARPRLRHDRLARPPDAHARPHAARATG